MNVRRSGMQPAGQARLNLIDRAPSPSTAPRSILGELAGVGGLHNIPAPVPPTNESCTLPVNPRLGQPSTDANGIVYTSTDPYFASQSARDTWASSHPTCTAPPFIPDQTSGSTAPAPITSNPLFWGIGAAVVAVGVGAAVVLTRSKSRSSSRRPSRR